MNLIEELETYRLEKRISQQELAKILGVSFCTINRWFTGKIKKPNKIQSYHIEKLLKGKKK
jgi:transcriptional regulator with XRE-family HTH domain